MNRRFRQIRLFCGFSSSIIHTPSQVTDHTAHTAATDHLPAEADTPDPTNCIQPPRHNPQHRRPNTGRQRLRGYIHRQSRSRGALRHAFRPHRLSSSNCPRSKRRLERSSFLGAQSRLFFLTRLQPRAKAYRRHQFFLVLKPWLRKSFPETRTNSKTSFNRCNWPYTRTVITRVR